MVQRQHRRHLHQAIEMSRIVVFTRTFLPVLGGLERNTFTLCRLLTEWGHSVTLITETLEEDSRTFPFRVVRTHSTFRIIREILHTDIVFVNGGISIKPFLAALLLRKSYAPIYQSSELYIRENDRGIGARLRHLLASHASLHITVSRFAKTQLSRLLPGKNCIAVPNPIDPELLELLTQSTPVDKEYDLLFAGRIIDGKGIFHLLEALKILHLHLPLRVAFAGDGEQKEKLIEAAAKSHLPIELVGRLDREALILAYRKARVLVVPSSTHTEGNPLVIAEALTCGTPVIASDQGAMVEAIGNAGATFLRYDAADLARKIEWMFSDDNLSTCTQSTKTRLPDFSNETYAERMRDVMHALTRLAE